MPVRSFVACFLRAMRTTQTAELDSQLDRSRLQATHLDLSSQRLRCSEVIGKVVARGGVEPPTFRFSVGRSYQLSYLAGRAGDPTRTAVRP